MARQNQTLLTTCSIVCAWVLLASAIPTGQAISQAAQQTTTQPNAEATAQATAQATAPSDAPSGVSLRQANSLDADIADSRAQLQQLRSQHGVGSLAVARQQAQLGSLLYLNRQPAEAIAVLRSAVAGMERELGIFNLQLAEPLGYLGLSQQALEQHEVADDTLNRAQQITHRARGTLNKLQIPLTYSRSDSLLAMGEWWKAEQLQYTAYDLNRHNFGPKGQQTLGAMNRLGTWLSRSGRTKPALSLYRIGLRDLLDENGEDTPEMAPLLEGMARAFLFTPGVRKRSLNLLQRVKNLTREHPDHFGPADQMVASLQLADALMMFSLEREAMPHYLAAWQSIEENPDFGPWEKNLFAGRHLVPGPLAEISESQAQSQTYYRFRFNLKEDGRPTRVKLIETNSHPTLVLRTMAVFRSLRFRPRFEDGKPVEQFNQDIRVSYYPTASSS